MRPRARRHPPGRSRGKSGIRVTGAEAPSRTLRTQFGVDYKNERAAALGDKPLDLTAIEFDLLECLARARGRVRSREQLIESITERNYDVYDRSVDVHICSLRKKLGDESASPRYIRTVRAVGYMFINPDDA